MPKLKKNYVMIQKSNNSNDKQSDDGGSDSDDEQYDSMIENGTSESDSDKESMPDDDELSASDTSNDENNDSGHNEGPTIASTSRKRKQPPMLDPNSDAAKKLKENKKLYKQPTVEEINQLRETENLFHSNLFRMQIREMLNELKIKEKYTKFIRTWLDELNTFLSGLKSMSEKEESTNLSWLKKSKVKLPINMEKLRSKNFHFQFLKPDENAFLIGSGRTDTMVGPKLMADICIPMPAKCFQKENYLNLIYDQKRALYLTFIANQMQKKKFHSTDLRFNYVQNNVYKPVLEISPDGNIGKKLSFRIFVSGSSESFKLNRFVPWNSNIRDSLFATSGENKDDEILLDTPNYNATVLFDLTMAANQKVLDEVGQHKNIREGIVLLKIWLRQHGLDAGFCGFGQHLMAMVVVYLFKERKIHATMSSYQVARNVWNHIASSSWNEPDRGISLGSHLDQPNQPTLERFHAHYDVVFVDSSGFLNLCSNLSLDVYLKIKFESQRAVDLLNNTRVNSFQALFMTSMPIYTKFDHLLNIWDGSVIDKVLKKFGKKEDLHSFAGLWYPRIVKLLSKVIRKGLGQRILTLTPIEVPTESWSVKEAPILPKKSIKLGLVLNPEMCYEILDKGPQANEPTAAEFREFWGEQAQLRRFQDGSITEACVWASANSSPAEKRLIVKQIVLYLLKYHFKIKLKSLQYIADEFDVAFKLDQLFYVFGDGSNDAENMTLNVIKKFDEIAKNLRACDDLPLDINSVQGISPVFRYCDPVPILDQAKSYKDGEKTVFQSYRVCEGVIQLGVSGKWPSELAALRRLKTAFHVQIARSLRTKFKLETRGGIDGVYLLKDGYVFKLEILHQKEIGLMRKTVSAKGVVQHNDTPESIEFEKRLNILPRITSALHGLYQRCSNFGPTVMIAKRWLYSQLLDSFLWPDECTELLIASQFLKVGAYPNPIQPQTGFLRFLHFLANCDFRNELVLLNFNDEIAQEEITELESKFTTERETFPCLTIMTSFDSKKDSIWTKSSPTPQVLARVVLLARHVLSVLEPVFNSNQTLPVRDLFVASYTGYDLIINLKPNLVHSCHAYNFDSVPKCGLRIDASVPAAGFDPVEYALRDLRQAYSEFALFFYNPCGGKAIAVIWKPECFDSEQEFKVANANASRIKANGMIECNVQQLIEDFKTTLRGLFYDIVDLRAQRMAGEES